MCFIDIPDHKFTGNQRTMTVKSISRIASPLSDLLIAMTVCNTASFDKSEKNETKDKHVKINMSPRNKKQLYVYFLSVLNILHLEYVSYKI